MNTEELVKLNEEIEDFEASLLDEKLDYELQKAKMWNEENWSELIGKAKPTQKDIEAYLKAELMDMERNYKQGEVLLKSKKRLLEIYLKMEGKE